MPQLKEREARPKPYAQLLDAKAGADAYVATKFGQPRKAHWDVAFSVASNPQSATLLSEVDEACEGPVETVDFVFSQLAKQRRFELLTPFRDGFDEELATSHRGERLCSFTHKGKVALLTDPTAGDIFTTNVDFHRDRLQAIQTADDREWRRLLRLTEEAQDASRQHYLEDVVNLPQEHLASW